MYYSMKSKRRIIVITIFKVSSYVKPSMQSRTPPFKFEHCYQHIHVVFPLGLYPLNFMTFLYPSFEIIHQSPLHFWYLSLTLGFSSHLY